MDRKNTRVYRWDNIKSILIILVVIGHFIDIFISRSNVYKTLFVYIYSFHMPLFIFVSGILTKKIILNNDSNKFNNKILEYVIFGFLLKILFSITSSLVTGKISFNLLGDKSACWFLFVLSMYMVTAKALKNKSFLPILIFNVILACFIGYDNTIKDNFYLSRYIIFFPFYWSGFKLNAEKLLGFVDKKYVKTILFLFAMLFAILVYFKIDDVYILRQVFTARHSFKSIGILNNGIFIRLLSYFISILMSLSIIAIVPNKKIPILTFIGTRTLPIYLFHCSVLHIFRYFGIHIIISNIEFINWKFIWLMVPVIVSLVLSTNIFENITKEIKNFIKRK